MLVLLLLAMVVAQPAYAAGPSVSIDSGPEGATGTNDPTPSFGFSLSDPLATAQCRIDGDSFAHCTSPYTTRRLADGSHTLNVFATSALGEAGPTASRSFVVDTTAPETAIVWAPPTRTTDTTPGFTFVGSQTGSRFECAVDGAAFTPCVSPTTVGPLSLGDHTFAVRAIDPVGNVDATPATVALTILSASADLPPAGDPIASLATDFGRELGRVTTKLQGLELPQIVRRRGVKIPRVRALLPGTASVRVTARRATVLRGKRRFGAAGRQALRLKLTRAGRRLLGRARRLRMTVTYTYTTREGIRMTASTRVTVWRDWLTLGEVARVARRWIPRYFDQRPRSLRLDRCKRSGPAFIRCSRVSWLHRGEFWFVRLRVRETPRGFRQRMSDAST